MRFTICLLLALPFFAALSCKKPTAPVAGRLYSGRIINSICGQTTIQFTDGATFGQNGWVDGTTTYNHVFKVANPCNWNTGNGPLTDIIKFYFTAPSAQNCMLCMAAGHTPDTAYNIQYVR